MIPLDRGKGVPSFDEMMDIALVAVDFDDPTTNVRGRRDRGKGVLSFDEMMDIALVEVDFDDPTTYVRGRRALAICKPTPRGY